MRRAPSDPPASARPWRRSGLIREARRGRSSRRDRRPYPEAPHAGRERRHGAERDDPGDQRQGKQQQAPTFVAPLCLTRTAARDPGIPSDEIHGYLRLSTFRPPSFSVCEEFRGALGCFRPHRTAGRQPQGAAETWIPADALRSGRPRATDCVAEAAAAGGAVSRMNRSSAATTAAASSGGVRATIVSRGGVHRGAEGIVWPFPRSQSSTMTRSARSRPRRRSSGPRGLLEASTPANGRCRPGLSPEPAVRGLSRHAGARGRVCAAEVDHVVSRQPGRGLATVNGVICLSDAGTGHR